MLTAQDYIEPGQWDLYNFAPDEGSQPVSVFLKNENEELEFPAIFLGEKRIDNKERPTRVTNGWYFADSIFQSNLC